MMAFRVIILTLVVVISSVDFVVSKEDQDLDIIHDIRIQRIINENYNHQNAVEWANTLTTVGNWTDVDYTIGCAARRANWPAQMHFKRILTMTSSWVKDGNTSLVNPILRAVDHWFNRDFLSEDCITGGGKDHLSCPCGTQGFWNTNWYCQMILMPSLVGSACLLLLPILSADQLSTCIKQTSRSYVRIDGDPNGTMGPMTGANLLDVASIGVSLSLLTRNHSLLLEAISGRVWGECTVNHGPSRSDGIKIDGAFMQHDGQLYNGNYGKVFITQFRSFLEETSGTSFSPPPREVQGAFLTMMKGSEWQIYWKGDEPNWVYSTIGRMVSMKYGDLHGIDLGQSRILNATSNWDQAAEFAEIIQRLNGEDPWELKGTKFFHTADFMVHRGEGYSVTLKMFSNRTTNSECNNAQNPYGFHLSDGNIYTYLTGHEYTDVFGAWDWHHIPGTTTPYRETPLSCGQVQFVGETETVGGLAHNNSGVAIMHYINPITEAFSFTKTFFFFPGFYLVQFVSIEGTETNSDIRTTLDQRQYFGSPIYVDGIPLSSAEGIEFEGLAKTIWHDRVGYQLSDYTDISVQVLERTANWSEIGISQGNETQTHFLSYIKHDNDNDEDEDDSKLWYIVRLNVDEVDFHNSPDSDIHIMHFHDASAVVRGAAYKKENNAERVIGLAFISPGEVTTGFSDLLWISSDAPALIMLQNSGKTLILSVSDPTQLLESVSLTLLFSDADPINLHVPLPLGALAGSTVTRPILFKGNFGHEIHF